MLYIYNIHKYASSKTRFITLGAWMSVDNGITMAFMYFLNFLYYIKNSEIILKSQSSAACPFSTTLEHTHEGSQWHVIQTKTQPRSSFFRSSAKRGGPSLTCPLQLHNKLKKAEPKQVSLTRQTASEARSVPSHTLGGTCEFKAAPAAGFTPNICIKCQLKF